MLSILLLALVVPTVLAARLPDNKVRLRFAWGGGVATEWDGSVAIDQGRLSDLRLLGQENDTPGSIWIDGSAIAIDQPKPRAMDGFDATVEFPVDGTLRVELVNKQGDRQTHLLRIDDILQSAQRVELDQQQNVLSVRRVDADRLRVEMQHVSRLFEPGTEMSFTVQPALVEGLDPALQLLVELESSTGQIVTSQQLAATTSAADGIPVRIALPQTGGAYTVRLALVRPGEKSRRLPFFHNESQSTVAERRFEIAVVGQAPALKSVDAWPVLLDVDPANPGWSSRLPDWVWLRNIPTMPRGPAGNANPNVVTAGATRLVQLQPGSTAAAGDWQAYPLPVTQPGRAYVVEIDLPTDASQQLAARVFEPGQSGELVPVGRGAVFVRDRAQTAADGATETQRYMFWPNAKSAMLVLQAAGDNAARYGHIRLRVAEVAAESTPQVESARSKTAFIDNPQWLRDFLPASNTSAVGYRDAHLALTRLSEYLQASGYDAVVLPVSADGGSLLAIDAGTTTPRLIGESLQSGMADLPAIDILDLALAMCAGQGIEVIPHVTCNATLPELERAIRAGAEDCELRSVDGQAWTAAYPGAGISRRYDILRPQVQQAYEQQLRRIAAAYGTHEAYGGLAIDLAGESSLLPGGAAWGCHGDDLAAFAKDASIDKTLADRWRAAPATLLDDEVNRGAWLAWRLQQVEAFQSRLVAQAGDEQTFMLGHRTLDDTEFTGKLRPSVGSYAPLAAWYAEHGVPADARWFVTPVLSRRQLSPVTSPLQYTSAPLSEATAPYASRQRDDAIIVGGTQLVPLPDLSRVTRDRFSAATSNQPLPEVISSDSQRQVLAEIVAAHDVRRVIYQSPVAATTIPTSPRRNVWHQVPYTSDTTEHAQDPVWVRSVCAAGQSSHYVVNASPWPIEVAVTFAVGTATTAVPLGKTAQAGTAYGKGNHVWQLTVEPFGIDAIEFAHRDVEVAGVRVEIPESMRSSLAARVKSLEQRDLKTARKFTPLDNLSLDRGTANAPPDGWQLTAQGGTALVDTAQVHEGAASLALTSNGSGVGVTSGFFAAPSTGQLALTAYVAGQDVRDDTKLYLIVENERGNYRQFATLDASRLRADGERQVWTGYTLPLEDVPQLPGERLWIRFELRGQGALRIDTLQMHDLVFPLEQYDESKQQLLALASVIHQARKRLDEGQPAMCQAVLDGYWARYVMAHFSEVTPTAVAAEVPPPADPQAPSAEPRVSDRLKGYLPGWFR